MYVCAKNASLAELYAKNNGLSTVSSLASCPAGPAVQPPHQSIQNTKHGMKRAPHLGMLAECTVTA